MADLLTTKPSQPTGAGARFDPTPERRSLRDYYIVIREHFWLALAVALLASLTLGYLQARQPPRYTATAQLKFERPERVITTEAVMDTTVRGDADINTYLQILGSGRLRTRLVESFTPAEIALLQRPYVETQGPDTPPPPIGEIISDVTIESVPRSLVVAITARARSGEAAALIANRYLDTFIDFLVERGSGTNEAAVDFLGRRAEELRREYEEAERQLQSYKQRQNLVSLDNSLNIVNERIRTLNAALTAARIERLDLEVYHQQVETFRRDGRNLLEIAFIANHGTVPALTSQLDEIKRRQLLMQERYLERHPRMIEVANSVASLQAQTDRAIDLAVAELATRLEKIRETERSLATEFAEAEREAFRLGALSVEFKSLENQALVKRNSYVAILDRLNQTATARNLDNIPVSPLDRAVAPARPFSPNPRAIARNCLLLAGLLFIGLPLLLNHFDDRLKSAWDVESFLGANLLGIVPDLAGVKPEDRPTLVNLPEATPQVEAFLAIYSTVKMQSKLDFPKSLLVTSTIPGEGKTLVSCNLAACFARHGKNVLLIDCDLRRPMLHRHFGLTNEQGLLPWAENGHFLADDPLSDQNLGIAAIGERLHLLRAGGRSKTPTALLEHPAFGDLLDALKRRFDLLVIDTPPVGAVTDGLLVAEHTDESIFVCRFNKAARQHIRVYIKALASGKNDLLGVVLNGMSPRRIEHYTDYRYYRSYRKYYGRPA
jgi:succinoglycan biosynthesis transport protein ExoP